MFIDRIKCSQRPWEHPVSSSQLLDVKSTLIELSIHVWTLVRHCSYETRDGRVSDFPPTSSRVSDNVLD